MNISAGTIARTICLAVALINQVLTVAGKDVLPFAEDEIYQLISLAFTIVASSVAWWKNNSFTKAAIKADKLLKEAK